MFHTKINQPWTGFTNQIFALITGIIDAYKKGDKVVVVDNFLNDIHNTTYTPISNIFNIQKINTFLKNNYDIIIIDKNNIQFNGPYNAFKLGWIDTFNDNMFEKILSNIIYNDDFILKSELILKDINSEKKINVIHLRLENDGISHWSKMNNLSHNNYKIFLENKYINIIKNYVSKTDENIILSSSLSNRVIDFLKNNNYSYKFTHKFFDDREKNAIVDLLVSKCCNNIFIGNFNIKNNNGSTFSYYIWKIINNVTKIYIDLDKIREYAVIIKE